MRDRTSGENLNDSPVLPTSDASLEGGTNGATVPVGDLRKGFTDLQDKPDSPSVMQREDSDGSTYVGDPLTRGGFLKRPEGWER